jgi:hypothetical protein
MKKYIIILTCIVTSLVISCEEVDFGDINDDPNSPTSASTASLLTGAQRSLSSVLTDTRPNLYVQYFANGQYPEESRYASVHFNYQDFYTGQLIDLQRIIELNTDEETKDKAFSSGSNADQIALSKLLKVYIFQTMTDRWGMIPYSESLKPLDYIKPKFDSQENIYKDLFIQIDLAMDQFDSGLKLTGDIIFNGDINKWKKFGNALKANMAMRLSKKYPSPTGFAATQFKDAYEKGLTKNEENMSYPFLSDEGNDNPWEDRFDTRLDYILSSTFVDRLIGNGTKEAPQDPRLAKYAEPIKGEIFFVGAPYGAQNSDTKDFSNIHNDIIHNKTAPAYYFTYTQTLFNKAEAIALGWIPGDTEAVYKEAIIASMAQWGVDADATTAYIASLNSFDGIKSIAYEKYVALYMHGYESWSDWRRQGVNGVALIAPQEATNGGGKIPNRQGYPNGEVTSNEDSYNAAVSAQGPDNLQTKVWWADN